MAKRMEFFVLDKSFKVVDIVDEFESVIWTERFSAYGDFEFYVRASIENIQRFPKGYYLFYPDSVSTMVIDQVKITSNLEDGDHLVVSGRSLESLLLRRVPGPWLISAPNSGRIIKFAPASIQPFTCCCTMGIMRKL